MSDKKLVNDNTVNYLVQKVKENYIPIKDIIDLQDKTVNEIDFLPDKELVPDENFDGFSSLTINPSNTEQITVKSTSTEQVFNKYINEITVEPVNFVEKNYSASMSSEILTPGDNEDGFSKVTVNPYSPTSEEKTIDFIADGIEVLPETKEMLSKVTVNPYTKFYQVLSGNTVEITDSDIPSGTTTYSNKNFTNNISSINLSSVNTLRLYKSNSLISVNAQDADVYAESFSGCTNLESIRAKTITIAVDAFNGCTNLTTLPEITNNTLYANSFKDCTSLQEVILNANISTIDKIAFSGCTALTTIYVRGDSSCITAQTLQALDTLIYNNATIVYTEN